jgi:hypothetical protein
VLARDIRWVDARLAAAEGRGGACAIADAGMVGVGERREAGGGRKVTQPRARAPLSRRSIDVIERFRFASSGFLERRAGLSQNTRLALYRGDSERSRVGGEGARAALAKLVHRRAAAAAHLRRFEDAALDYEAASALATDAASREALERDAETVRAAGRGEEVSGLV